MLSLINKVLEIAPFDHDYWEESMERANQLDEQDLHHLFIRTHAGRELGSLTLNGLVDGLLVVELTRVSSGSGGELYRVNDFLILQQAAISKISSSVTA